MEITKVEGEEVKASFVGEITFAMPTETSDVGLAYTLKPGSSYFALVIYQQGQDSVYVT